MRRIAFLVLSTLLIWGTPAFAGPAFENDFDQDGVVDSLDNCSLKANPAQDDTDGDDCGNLCDADYNQDGIVGFDDFGRWVNCFGLFERTWCQCVEPISPNRQVGFADLGCFVALFGRPPGPSGTTAGTVACP